MKMKIQKVGNMVFLVADGDVIFKAWDEYSFTEKKLENAKKRIANDMNGNVTFTDER